MAKVLLEKCIHYGNAMENGKQVMPIIQNDATMQPTPQPLVTTVLLFRIFYSTLMLIVERGF
jgi:hypothetical protein